MEDIYFPELNSHFDNDYDIYEASQNTILEEDNQYTYDEGMLYHITH